MTALDTEVLAEVQSALAEIGATARFVEQTLTADPSTGRPTAGAPTNHDIPASPLYNHNERFDRENRQIQQGDSFILIAGQQAFEPQKGMDVVVDGDTWQIVHLSNLRTSNESVGVVAYEIQLRR